MLRSPFYYIVLDEILNTYGKEVLMAKLNEPDNVMKSFLHYYAKVDDKDVSYKSLERCGRRFEESDCYPIILPYKKKKKNTL
jgi:hypothetical protein